MRYIFAVLLFLITPVALADANLASGNAYTVYATANGHALVSIFSAVKGIVNDSSYMSLLAFVAVFSFVGFAILAAVDAKKIEQFFGILVIIVVITQFGLKQKADIVIHDPFYGTVFAVQDVPAGVAIPISVISTVGHEITVMLETYFSTPSALQVSKTGTINMASSLIKDASTMSIQDSHLKATMASFAHDCILPSIAQGRMTGAQIVDSIQLFGTAGTLKLVNPSLLTTVYGVEGGGGTSLVTYCGAVAGSSASSTIKYENYYGGSTVTATNSFDYLSQLISIGAPQALAKGRGVAYGTPAYSWLENAISSAQTYLSDGVLTASGGDSVRQAAAANLLSGGLSSAVAQSGDSALASTVALSQAIKGQESNWVMAAAIFNDIAGYIFSLLQALMIGLTPLFIIAAFVPGTKMKILITVGQVFVWLALWQPTFAILNFIITEYAQGPFGGSISDSNYSMMTAPIVSQTTDRFIAAAGFMGASVPMITWGIVKGGMAFTSFVGGAMGGSFASAAANMASTGNISLGNQSYDNYSANSVNAEGGYRLGVGGVSTAMNPAGASTLTQDQGGMQLTSDNVALNKSFQATSEAASTLAKNQTAAGRDLVSDSSSVMRANSSSVIEQASQSTGDSGSTTDTTQNSDQAQVQSTAESALQLSKSLTAKDSDMTSTEASSRVAAAIQASPELNTWFKKLTPGKDGNYGGFSGGDSALLKGIKISMEGANARSESGKSSSEASDTLGTTDSSVEKEGATASNSTTETDALKLESNFAENYLRSENKQDTEQYQNLQQATKDFSKGEQLIATGTEAQKQAATMSGSTGFRDLADMRSQVQDFRSTAQKFENDGVSFSGEKELNDNFKAKADDLEQFTSVGTDSGAVRGQVADNTQGAVSTPGADKVGDELDAGKAKVGGDVGSNSTAESIKAKSGETHAAYDQRLSSIQDESAAKSEDLDPKIQEARDDAKEIQEAGLWDISRNYDLANKSEVAAFAGIAAANGLADLAGSALGAKAAGSATNQMKSLQTMSDAGKLSSKDQGMFKKIMSQTDDMYKGAKGWIANKSAAVGNISKQISSMDAGDFKKFATDPKVMKEMGKVMGPEWVEKQMAKFGAGLVAGGTGVGAAVTVGLWGSTAYDGIQAAGAISSALSQYNETGSVNLSEFYSGNSDAEPKTERSQSPLQGNFKHPGKSEESAPPTRPSTVGNDQNTESFINKHTSAAFSDAAKGSGSTGPGSATSSTPVSQGSEASNENSYIFRQPEASHNSGSSQGLTGTDSVNPFGLDGVTGRMGNNSATPERSNDETLALIDQMGGSSLQQWAQGQNLQNSTLLNQGPDGGTILEAVASNKITQEEAVTQYGASSSDFTSLTAAIPGAVA